MSDKNLKSEWDRGLELYALMKPWTYTDNDFNNRFNTHRVIQKVKNYFRGEMPARGYFNRLGYKAFIDLPTFESGRITIPHRESISNNPQKQIYGFAIYSKADSFYYYYFIKEHTKLMNGFSEYRIELNYFATYGEPCIYSDFTYKGTPPAPNYLNVTEIPPLQNPNLIIDRHSLIDDYFYYDGIYPNRVNDVVKFKRFQNSLNNLPADIDIENNTDYLKQAWLNVFGSTVGTYYNESTIGPWLWKDCRLVYESSRGRIGWQPNGGVLEEEKYMMIWPNETVVPDVLSSDWISKVNRSLDEFKWSLDTDKFLLVNFSKNWWRKQDANRNENIAKKDGLPDNNTVTLLVPLNERRNEMMSTAGYGFPYKWLLNMFASGHITGDNVLGCVRIKSNNFSDVRAIAMIEPSQFFFRSGNLLPEWESRYFICGFVVNSASYTLQPRITEFYREFGWNKQYLIQATDTGYNEFNYFNNPQYFNDYQKMSNNMYRFKGTSLLYVTNDDKIIKYDHTDFNKSQSPVLRYAPIGYENLWLSVEDITSVGTSVPKYFTNFATEPWKNSEFNLGFDNSRLNHFIGIPSKAAQFWADQRNAWQTASNQAKFNIGAGVIKTIGGAVAGSVVPVVGTITGALSGASSLIGSVQAYQNLKAQERDIALQGGGVPQGNSGWLRSRYINVYDVRINTRTIQDLYNFFATTGYNTNKMSSSDTVDPNNARYLFLGSVLSSYKLLPFRVHRSSADILMDNIREYFTYSYRIQLSSNIINWLVNLFTHGVTLRFEGAGAKIVNYRPEQPPTITVPQPTQELESNIEQLEPPKPSEDNDQNRTSNTATPKEKQGDDA